MWPSLARSWSIVPTISGILATMGMSSTAAGSYARCLGVFITVCNALAKAMEFAKYSDTWIADNVLCKPRTSDCEKLKCVDCLNCRIFSIQSPSDSVTRDEISFKLWNKQPLIQSSVTQTVGECYELFVHDLMPDFVKHHLIKRNQAKLYQEMKSELQPGDLLLHFDFSENSTCISQDTPQGTYWNQNGVTILCRFYYSHCC